ncbi:28S ribosomal protein s10, mitochondrial [Plakobranchus ocellatus]|uniref:Small ribosomal subunit protein uS10m n=1 Tax=Plakobranchus ocellatus TaxID=259542 RepID=A0AAV4DAZ9_9GAST|nr:28S ribosomal protein s10, mitochondrial [Plakobranchus ocellatus]
MATPLVSQQALCKDELYRKISVEVKGHSPQVLNSYQKFTVMAAEELGVHIDRIFEPPRVMTRMSLMKSVFVHKKHFHQYEMRTHYRVFERVAFAALASAGVTFFSVTSSIWGSSSVSDSGSLTAKFALSQTQKRPLSSQHCC